MYDVHVESYAAFSMKRFFLTSIYIHLTNNFPASKGFPLHNLLNGFSNWCYSKAMVVKYRSFMLFAIVSCHIDSLEYLKEPTFSIMQPCQLDRHYILPPIAQNLNFFHAISSVDRSTWPNGVKFILSKIVAQIWLFSFFWIIGPLYRISGTKVWRKLFKLLATKYIKHSAENGFHA